MHAHYWVNLHTHQLCPTWTIFPRHNIYERRDASHQWDSPLHFCFCLPGSSLLWDIPNTSVWVTSYTPHLRPLARLHSDGSNDESRPNLSLIGWLHLEADIEPHLEAFANVMNFTLDLLIRKYVRCLKKKKTPPRITCKFIIFMNLIKVEWIRKSNKVEFHPIIKC